jgi:hypothetical protein
MAAEGGKSGSVNSQRLNWKLVLGTLLLIFTPVLLFVKPTTEGAIVRDLVLVIWWAFVLWLLVSGIKASKQTNQR